MVGVAEQAFIVRGALAPRALSVSVASIVHIRAPQTTPVFVNATTLGQMSVWLTHVTTD